MGQLHIRDVDDGLLKKLRIRAIENGMTFRAYVLIQLGGDSTESVTAPVVRKVAAVVSRSTRDSGDSDKVESPKPTEAGLGKDPKVPVKFVEKPEPPKKRGKHFMDTW